MCSAHTRRRRLVSAARVGRRRRSCAAHSHPRAQGGGRGCDGRRPGVAHRWSRGKELPRVRRKGGSRRAGSAVAGAAPGRSRIEVRSSRQRTRAGCGSRFCAVRVRVRWPCPSERHAIRCSFALPCLPHLIIRSRRIPPRSVARFDELVRKWSPFTAPTVSHASPILGRFLSKAHQSEIPFGGGGDAKISPRSLRQ